MAKKKAGGWGIGIVAAAAVVGAFLYLTVQPAPKVSPTVSKPTPTQAIVHNIVLGSYGSAVRRNGQLLALQIHPIAELQGPQDQSPPALNGPTEQEIIGNLFLRFPDLLALPQDSTAQARLANEIRVQLNTQLAAQHSAWHVESVQLHPSLGPIPPTN
ncbi:hypothetical protein AB4090_04200 [Acidithiobacillus sp. IBUN Pt1247-S3]|uniref:hypothetical protein n=1 Tax=Acidithiobacillus sp. IBUN Pt1247-S3 TaxID=3166642 RepID=UPI0034E3D5B8